MSDEDKKKEWVAYLGRLLQDEFGNEGARLYNKAKHLLFRALAAVEGEASDVGEYNPDWFPIHHEFTNIIEDR